MTPAIPISLSPFLPSPDDVTLRCVVDCSYSSHTHTYRHRPTETGRGGKSKLNTRSEKKTRHETGKRAPTITDERTNERMNEGTSKRLVKGQCLIKKKGKELKRREEKEKPPVSPPSVEIQYPVVVVVVVVVAAVVHHVHDNNATTEMTLPSRQAPSPPLQLPSQFLSRPSSTTTFTNEI